MREPLVSVIVPIYRVEAYIGACVRSLMAQSYRRIEYIFVNDGTPDRSMEVLKENLDCSRNIIIIDKENGGLPQARKTGLEASHGEYILHLDSDDWIEADAVEKLVEAVVKTGCDLIYFDFWKEYGSRRKLDSEKYYTALTKKRWMHRLYNDGAYGYIWAKFSRRELYDGVFFPRYNMHEDVVVATQLIWNSKAPVHLKKPLIHYRRDNLSSATRAGKKTRRGQMARNYLDFLAGESPSALEVENEILLRAAWVAYSLDRDIFKEYPFLKERASKLPLMAGRRVLLFEQLILKLWLHLR